MGDGFGDAARAAEGEYNGTLWAQIEASGDRGARRRMTRPHVGIFFKKKAGTATRLAISAKFVRRVRPRTSRRARP